jgi:hypothetical protein
MLSLLSPVAFPAAALFMYAIDGKTKKGYTDRKQGKRIGSWVLFF